MPRMNTIDLVNAAIEKNETHFANSSKDNWDTRNYNEDKTRLANELASELAESSYFEYKAIGNKISVRVVRDGRNIDRKFKIDLKYYLDECETFYQVDMEEFTCSILGTLQNNTMGIREYFGDDHPSNKDDFNQWDKQKWLLIDYATKRLKKLLNK